MDESQKPFACTIEGCQMTFTNEDHLNWHHKKHDMVLNLGLTNKTIEVADQTPTPTRFIRNCEEVGLFQDLQNVNPFDETFKKAMECAKTGSLHVPEVANNDDTLHTPHIFPQVESSNKYTKNDNQSNHLNEFYVTTSEENNEPNESYNLIVVEDENESNQDRHKSKPIDLKSKLKETIKNKSKSCVAVKPVPLEKLVLNQIESPKRAQSSDREENSNKKQKIDETISEEKLKIREMNRAAQLRCRKRKKIQWKRMEDELKVLKGENTKLNQENQNFKHKFYSLKELLLKYKNGSINDSASVLTKIEEVLNSSVPVSRKNTSENVVSLAKHKIIQKKMPITSPIVPVPILQNQEQKPLLIQVVGSVAQLAVSVLPNK